MVSVSIKKDSDLEEKLIGRDGKVNECRDLILQDYRMSHLVEVLTRNEECQIHAPPTNFSLDSYPDLDFIYSNEEINKFLSLKVAFEDNGYYNRNFGLLASKMCQNLWNVEKKQIKLNPPKRVMYLGSFLRGNTQDEFELVVLGDASYFFGLGSVLTKFIVKGDLGNWGGACMSYCEMHVQGKLKDQVGDNSSSSEFHLYNADVDKYWFAQEMQDCSFYLYFNLLKAIHYKDNQAQYSYESRSLVGFEELKNFSHDKSFRVYNLGEK